MHKIPLIVSGICGVMVIVIVIVVLQPTDLPENDSLCSTQILVQTTSNIDRQLFSETVLEEMGFIDSRFAYDGRDISIENLTDGKLRITIDGIWSPSGSGAELIESLEKLDVVESVLEQDRLLLVTICQ